MNMDSRPPGKITMGPVPPPPARPPSAARFGAAQYSSGPPIGFTGNSAATWAVVALFMPFCAPIALFLGVRGYRVAAANGGEGMGKSIFALIAGGFGTFMLLILMLSIVGGT